MLARPSAAFLMLLLAPSPVSAEEECPRHFREYGLFLQARTSCGGGKEEYGAMPLMRACAKQTPKEAALSLMDEGRREWARRVMRSSLGTACAQVMSQSEPPASKGETPAGRRSRR